MLRNPSFEVLAQLDKRALRNVARRQRWQRLHIPKAVARAPKSTVSSSPNRATRPIADLLDPVEFLRPIRKPTLAAFFAAGLANGQEGGVVAHKGRHIVCVGNDLVESIVRLGVFLIGEEEVSIDSTRTRLE